MRLTDYTDYALRVLMYVGSQTGRLVTIQEIADNHGISKNHLTKIVHRLGLAGLVTTVRGRTGGLRLARDPASITIGSVVRLTEPDFIMVECFDETRNTCSLSPICVLKNTLGRATSAYLQELDHVTLANVLFRPPTAPVVQFAT
ncbi:MAG TPA: Rrf2 family transcriptional regulator [Telluria sp.]|nr:Rrf2 family transcriptional regulator [Telluria sp.]